MHGLETKRLYWEEPLETSFRGRIVGTREVDGRAGVVLDRTLFHPEGGGQPADRGHISLLSDEAAVLFGRGDLGVVGAIDGGSEIVHLLDVPVPASGLPEMPAGGWEIKGFIDWDYRFDLMQQHTGQHILSRAFEEILGARTIGFHLGKDYVSIDLDIQAVSDALREQVEDRANEVVFRGMAVTAKDYAKNDLPTEIRTRLPIEAERVRVVSVGEFDACACSGTHVVNSGQVGLIKVNRIDRAHGGVRVIFRCGKRALSDYRMKERLLYSVAAALSVGEADVPQAVESVLQRSRELEKDLEEARETALELQVERRAQAARERGEAVIVEAFGSLAPDRLKFAARRLGEASGKLTVCFSREPRFSAVVVSPAGSADARDIVSKIALRWGGRGGGSPGLAQLGSKEPLAVPDDDVIAGVKEACAEVLAGTQ